MENKKDNMPASGGSAEGGKKNFTITNITCDACIKISSMVLKKIPGVTSVEIDKDGKASIESEKEITEEEITNALKEVEKTVEF
jgi:copper chaperone CopZ